VFEVFEGTVCVGIEGLTTVLLSLLLPWELCFVGGVQFLTFNSGMWPSCLGTSSPGRNSISSSGMLNCVSLTVLIVLNA